jgi:hypothetical protein
MSRLIVDVPVKDVEFRSQNSEGARVGFERQFFGGIEGGEELEAGAEFDFIDGRDEIGEVFERLGEFRTIAAYMVLRPPSTARITLKEWPGTDSAAD